MKQELPKYPRCQLQVHKSTNLTKFMCLLALSLSLKLIICSCYLHSSSSETQHSLSLSNSFYPLIRSSSSLTPWTDGAGNFPKSPPPLCLKVTTLLFPILNRCFFFFLSYDFYFYGICFVKR